MSRTATAIHRSAPRGRSGAWRVAALATALVLVVGACGSDDALEGNVVEQGLGCSTNIVERRVDDPPTIAETTKVAKETGTKDVIVGKGCDIDPASYLSLDLVGALAADGKEFRNTFADDGIPLTTRLGQGRLLAGLETGIQGMKVGGRRTITIPAAEGYGADGDLALAIPADADLVFVVDLVGATRGPRWCTPDQGIAPVAEGGTEGKPTEVDMPAEAPEELITTDLTEGEGAEVVEGNYVEVNYLGIACDSGTVFDNSWDTGTTLPVTVGEGGVIEGFDAGLLGMKEGGRRQIDIPADQAYGSTTEKEPTIGPNDPLTFIIEVVSIAEKPPATTTTAPADPTASTTIAGGEATTTAPAADGDATTTTTAPAADGGATTTTIVEATTTTEG